MVLGPLSELVKTSRRLTDAESDDRLHQAGADEFAQLVEAYRSLGKQLESQERRRMETLQQTAVTLNHELNTAMTGIELQLQVMKQRAGRRRPPARNATRTASRSGARPTFPLARLRFGAFSYVPVRIGAFRYARRRPIRAVRSFCPAGGTGWPLRDGAAGRFLRLRGRRWCVRSAGPCRVRGRRGPARSWPA